MVWCLAWRLCPVALVRALAWLGALASVSTCFISPTTPGMHRCSVDMSEEEDELQGAITSCLASLLLGIETRLEGALAAMARLNWAGMEMVRVGLFGWAGHGWA